MFRLSEFLLFNPLQPKNMDITQKDRDSLRDAQQKLNADQVIGNLVEHRTQDPKKYLKQSREETSDQPVEHEFSNLHYKSVHYQPDTWSAPPSIPEEKELELPISLEEVQSNSWINMDQVEWDKLEWLAKRDDKQQLEQTTCFDRQGRPTKDQSEGHTIDYLINLLDSNYKPQVAYGLNIIANIANLCSLGYYDGSFTENLHETLIKSCLLRVRHHIDDSNETILDSAWKCLSALICNTHLDEVVLDRINPLISESLDTNMWLQNSDMSCKEFTIDMKDAECVELDAIRTLIYRTEIIARITFLLNNQIGNYQCILDVLIRMARHSIETCFLLQELVPEVIRLFLPVSITTENKDIRELSIKALKFIRIVALATREIEILSRLTPSNQSIDSKIPNSILPVIESYLTIDSRSCYQDKDNDMLCKLHVEALRTVKLLVQLKKFKRPLDNMFSLIQKQLFILFKSLTGLKSTKPSSARISFEWQLAAHLIDITGFVDPDKGYLTTGPFIDSVWLFHVRPLLLQWMTDIVRDKTVPSIDVSIAVATAVNHYIFRASTDVMTNLLDVMFEPNLQLIRQRIYNFGFFKKLIRVAEDRSFLANGFLKEDGRFRDPKCLPSFGCLNYNRLTVDSYNLNPIIDNDSPFILLNVYTRLLRVCKTSASHLHNAFIKNIDLSRMIRVVTSLHCADVEVRVQESVLIQHEVKAIARSLLLLAQQNSRDVEASLDPSLRLECYNNICNCTISTIGLLGVSSKEATNLKDELFNEILLNHDLQVTVEEERIVKSKLIKKRGYIDFDFTSGILSIEPMSESETKLLLSLYTSLEQNNRFWVVQPLIEYYLNHVSEDAKKDVQGSPDQWFKDNIPWRETTTNLDSYQDSVIIRLILKFHSNLLLLSPTYCQLVIKPELEDYLCPIGSIFLSQDIFLDETVNKALSDSIKHLLQECLSGKSKIYPFRDASRLIKPLNNLPVADFFNKLVDQFEAASYGDQAFSNFLLLFLTPKSDKIFRKKLYQEKVETCLSQLRIPKDSVWLPWDLFSEKEEDQEILSLIRRSRPYLSRGSFLYECLEYQESLLKVETST